MSDRPEERLAPANAEFEHALRSLSPTVSEHVDSDAHAMVDADASPFAAVYEAGFRAGAASRRTWRVPAIAAMVVACASLALGGYAYMESSRVGITSLGATGTHKSASTHDGGNSEIKAVLRLLDEHEPTRSTADAVDTPAPPAQPSWLAAFTPQPEFEDRATLDRNPPQSYVALRQRVVNHGVDAVLTDPAPVRASRADRDLDINAFRRDPDAFIAQELML